MYILCYVVLYTYVLYIPFNKSIFGLPRPILVYEPKNNGIPICISYFHATSYRDYVNFANADLCFIF